MHNHRWIILSLCLLTAGVFVIGIYIAPNAREMGMMELNGGKYKEAFDYYSDLHTKGDNSVNAIIPLTTLNVYYGDVDNAIALIEHFLEKNPHSTEARKKLAQLYKASQRFYSYCRMLEELQKAEPSVDKLRELADTYDFLAMYEKEIPALARLLDSAGYKPREEDYVKLATLYRINNQLSDAVNTIDSYIALRRYDVSMDTLQFGLQLLFEANEGTKAFSIASVYMKQFGNQNDAIVLSEHFLEAYRPDDAYTLIEPYFANLESYAPLLEQWVNVQLARGKRKEIYTLLSDMFHKSILPDEFLSTLIDLAIDNKNYALAESLLRMALIKDIPENAIIRYAHFSLEIGHPDIALSLKNKLGKDYLSHNPVLLAILNVAISDTPQTMGVLLALPQSVMLEPEKKLIVADICLRHNYTQEAFALFDAMHPEDFVGALDNMEFARVYLDAGAADKGRHVLDAIQQYRLFSRIKPDEARLLLAAGEGKTDNVKTWLKDNADADSEFLADIAEIAARYHHNDISTLLAALAYKKNPTLQNRIQLARTLIYDKRYGDALSYLEPEAAANPQARKLYVDLLGEIVEKSPATASSRPFQDLMSKFAAIDLKSHTLTHEEKMNLVWLLEKSGLREQAEDMLMALAAGQPFASREVSELLGIWGERLSPKALRWMENRARNAPDAEKPGWLAYLNNTGNPQSVLLVLGNALSMPAPVADEYINALVIAHMPAQLENTLLRQIESESYPGRVEKLATTADQENLPKAAEKGWRKLLALDPNHARALKEVGMLAYDGDHNAEAFRLLDKYLRKNEGDYLVNYAYADILSHQGQPERAKAYFARALREIVHMNNKDEKTLIMQADLLYKLDHMEEALALYRKLIRDYPQDKKLKTNYAEFLVNTQRYEEAQTVLARP